MIMNKGLEDSEQVELIDLNKQLDVRTDEEDSQDYLGICDIGSWLSMGISKEKF